MSTTYVTTQKFSSSFNIAGRAEMELITNCKVYHNSQSYDTIIQPESISFNCKRNYSCIDADIYEVYCNAVNGNSYMDMHDSPLVCKHDEVAGGCGNRRGKLSECRCTILNRRTDPKIRGHYEDVAIEKIMQVISNRVEEYGDFTFNLAVFCSGGLLGEEILLFKLFHFIRSNNYSGEFNVSLIDKVYGTAIKTSSFYHSKLCLGQAQNSLEGPFGEDETIQQFLIEICKSAPKSITFSGQFFYDDESYISAVQNNSACKHDFLIGADIVGLLDNMKNIERYAGTGIIPPFLLEKDRKEENVATCDIIGNIPICNIIKSEPAQKTIYEAPKNTSSRCTIS